MKRLLFILFILAIGCSKKTDENDKFTFVLPKYPVTPKSTDPKDPPPPPLIQYPYYYDYNFIIDSSGGIFYFQRERQGWLCGTGIDASTPPNFIYLMPKDLVEIPVNSIKLFIDLNILNQDFSGKRAVIAVIKDMTRSEGIFKISNLFKEKNVQWLFRKATQEESIVLSYRKRQMVYDYEAIKWDPTKIQFLPSRATMKRFKMPTIHK